MDEWLARIDGNGTKVFLRDALGSTVGLSDAAGAITDAYTYDPFGRSIAQGTTASAERYTGREQDDPESYYYRARYYRPPEGRFLSEDAIRLAPDASLYAYVGGDPVSRIDPTGRLQGPLPMPGLGAGAGAAASGAAAAGLAAAGVSALVAFDVWIIQHDIDLLRQLCEAYGYCTPTSQKCEKRPPTLSRCLDACEGGAPVLKSFCNSIPDKATAARCWSQMFKGVQAAETGATTNSDRSKVLRHSMPLTANPL
jgi:RHS repeat-associated protein